MARPLFSLFELPAFAGILSNLSLLRSSALFASGVLLVSSPVGGGGGGYDFFGAQSSSVLVLS